MSYSQPTLGGVRIVQYATPTTGATLTANDNTNAYLINPAGTLATLTVVMPANPKDGQVFSVSSTQILTALTMTGTNVQGGLSSLTVNGFGSWVWSASGGNWFRIG